MRGENRHRAGDMSSNVRSLNLPAQDTRSRWLVAAALALATFLLYLPVGRHDFINFDDHLYVYDNDQVKPGLSWAGVAWAFTTGHAFNWHPVTWLSHMLDCQLFGQNAGAHHLVNLLFHAANTVLLLLVLARWTGAPGRSALVAALFALHPLHVESVAWIAERKDVLSTLFGLLTLWAYGRYMERPARSWYWGSLVFFTLGLMSKPMLVTLPFVLLLLDYWPLRRWTWPTTAHQLPAETAAGSGLRHSDLSPLTPALSPSDGERVSAGRVRGILSDSDKFHRSGVLSLRSRWQLVIEKWPFFALSAASCLVTFLIQKQSAVISVEKLPLALRITNALVAYGRYLGKTFWPADLTIFYPYPAAWPLWQVATAVLVLALISLLAWRMAASHPYLLVGWLWYLGTLVPVIGIVQVGSQSLADRYTYIPLIGIFIMVTWGTADLAARWRHGGRVATALGIVVLAACAVLTWKQLQFWRDSATLFRHGLEVTSNNAVAHNNLGDALAAAGKTDEALRHYQEAIRIRPALGAAHNNVGTIWLAQGKYDAAAKCFATAVELQPRNAEAHNNLGLALASQGKLDAARASYLAALRVAPHYAQAHSNLGAVLLQLGQLDEAVAHFRAAVRANPSLAEAHYNLAIALAKQGRMPEALASQAEAIRLNPDLKAKRSQSP